MRRLLSLFLLIALLAGCSGAPAQPDNATPPPDAGGATAEPAPGATAEPGGENGQVVISYAAWDYERQIYEPLAKKFSEENPNIKVVIVPLDDMMNVPQDQQNPDSFNPLTQLRRVASGADTAPAFFITPEAYGSGLLLDLKPQMDADASFKRDDFLPGALEQFSGKGGTWMLPRYLNVQIMSYNKDLFKNAGLPDPKPDWKWADLLATAEQIAKKNGSKVDTYGYFDSSGGFLPMVALLQEKGIDLFNTPAQKIRVDSPDFVDTVKRVRALMDSGAIFRPIYKEGPPAQNTDPAQMIRDGKVGIWGQDMGFVGACDGPGCDPQQQSFSFAVGKAPFPPLPGGFYGGGADGYMISAGTVHPNEAWKWIEFLSRQQTDQPQPGGAPIFNPPGRVPARQSLADQTDFWKNLDPEAAEAYKWAVAHPAPILDRTPDNTVFGALGQSLEQVFGAERKDPEKVLQEAQKQMEQQIAQAQLTPTPKPDTGGPVVVATPEPQTAPEGATTVKFVPNGYNPSDLRRLARSFRDQHPDVYVEIQSTDTFTEAPTLAKLATMSDCFAWWGAPQSDEDFKALLDLQPLFDADASFPQSDFAPAMLAPYQRDGGLFGVPYAASLRTLNYNKNAFSAAGIQPPTFQWKPDDFLAAAQALTKGEGDKKQYGYIPLGGPQTDMMFFIGQFGARLTTGSGKDARPNFADPKVVQAIQWYLDLATVHKVMPPLKFPYKRDDPGFEDKSYEMIQNGRAGMWFDQGYGMFGGPAESPVIKGGGPGGPGGPQRPNFEVGIAPLPVGANGLSSSDFNLRGFHISAQTQQAQGCWEWIKFMTGDLNNLQDGIPARASVLASDAFAKQAQPNAVALAKTYGDALKQAGKQSAGAGDMNAFYSMDLYWFFKALSEALEKKTDLAQGLADAQTKTSAFMECMAKNPNKPATCARQADPQYQGYNTEDPQPLPGVGGPRG